MNGSPQDSSSYYAISGESNVNVFALIFLFVVGVAVLRSKRQGCIAAMLLAALVVPLGQQFVVLGLHIRFFRVLILIGFFRLLIRHENSGFRLTRVDKLFAAWALVTLICTIIRGPKAETFGVAYDALGTYFIFRMLMVDAADVIVHLRVLAIAAVAVAACMAVEEFTHRNPLHIFGGVPEFTLIREGRFRCQGPFRHPILAGTYAATLVPLLVGLWYQTGRNRGRAFLGLMASTFSTITAASSGALLTLVGVMIGIALWIIRTRMKLVRGVVLAALVVSSLVMTAPVWYLIARVSDVTGGTGWHRAFLIDQSVNYFSEWALVGSNYTAHWARDPNTILNNIDPNNMDITNQYIHVGLEGGFLGLLIFLAIITNCFAIVGRSWRASGDTLLTPKMKWALGVCLAAHCTAFISISYFDQIQVFWFWLLAVISTLSLDRRQVPLRRGNPNLRWRSPERQPAVAPMSNWSGMEYGGRGLPCSRATLS
jgi:O-antigen ligase